MGVDTACAHRHWPVAGQFAHTSYLIPKYREAGPCALPGVWILWEHARRMDPLGTRQEVSCRLFLSCTLRDRCCLYGVIYIPRTGMLIHSENAWGFGSAGGNQAQHWHVDPLGKCLVPKPWVLAITSGRLRAAHPPPSRPA